MDAGDFVVRLVLTGGYSEGQNAAACSTVALLFLPA